MGKIKETEPVKLIVGAISGERALFDEVEKNLTEKFGPVDLKSPVWDFTQTDYYREEMGPDLKRIFFSFERPIEPGWLPEIKIFTNDLENNYLAERSGPPATAGRRINLDPGYLTLAKLVLATTKDYSHRLYLADGVFGEITLSYKDSQWQTNPWTYPDYQTKEYREFFKRVRETLPRSHS